MMESAIFSFISKKSCDSEEMLLFRFHKYRCAENLPAAASGPEFQRTQELLRKLNLTYRICGVIFQKQLKKTLF
jgi:hypothetical protein